MLYTYLEDMTTFVLVMFTIYKRLHVIILTLLICIYSFCCFSISADSSLRETATKFDFLTINDNEGLVLECIDPYTLTYIQGDVQTITLAAFSSQLFTKRK